MDFKFSEEMQRAADKFANDGLLAEYEKFVDIESFSDFSEKKGRKIIQGVCHENGKLIATDGNILIAVKENYGKELEGLKTSTNFALTDEEKTKFVDWKKVIPEVENSKTEVFTDDNFTQLEKLAVVSQTIGNYHHSIDIVFVKVGELFFNAKYIFMFCVMAKKYGLHNVFINYNPDYYAPRPSLIFGDNGDICFMPLIKLAGDIYFDFENSQGIEIEKYMKEISKIENPFSSKFKVKKLKPHKVNVTRAIKPSCCPMENDDCTDCPYNKDYDEWNDEVTCTCEDGEE